MAAKRFLNESNDDDNPSEKQRRTLPTLANVIGEVILGNSLQHLCSALEPVVRKVVNEELERGLTRCSRSLMRTSSFRVQAPEPSSLQLVFSKRVSLPIFTGTKILDSDNCPLQILVVDAENITVPILLPRSIKIEIVVLEGDFGDGDSDNWTPEEFEANIVKERTGKRPLLAGELIVTMKDGVAPVGDIDFTDNSSWIRSRKFRIGARVAAGSYQGVRIRETMTESFVVKDHRGELYKKHHPPMLHDEVWRLKKIGKDGVFHNKLKSNNINTVQDFLMLSVVDLPKLRRILGPAMSDKMWEVTINHARTCDLGTRLHIFREANCFILLNPICQVVRAVIDGNIYPTCNFTDLSRGFIDNLIKKAYANWKSLEQIDGVLNETALLTQGEMVDQCQNQPQTEIGSFEHDFY